MSAENSLSEILKIAVVGLQNSSEYEQALLEEVSAVLKGKHYSNEGQRFLDAAALTSLQAELSRVPEADSFDELPEIPEESLRHLNPAQSLLVERLFNHEQPSPGKSAMLLLQRFGYALPDTIFCDLMATEHLDKSLRLTISSVASARAQWLTQMNKRWHSLLGEALQENEFHREALAKQKRHLAKLRPEDVASFCCEQWGHCNANGRRLLLAYLRSYPSQEIEPWLAENLNDKSAHLKRELLRWFITREHPLAGELKQKAAAQLQLYLDSSKVRKPDLNTPEELSTELTELAILDQDYLGTNQSKAVQRLAQLLVLTGPELWAQQLQCNSAEAMERMLKTRFAEELEPYLLEAALYHQDESALQRWCKKVKLKEHSRLPDQLASMLNQLGPVQSRRSVEILLQQKHIALLLSVKLWQQLADFHCPLEGDHGIDAFEQWCQHALKHRYYFDSELASKMPLWLELNPQQVQQNKHWRALRAKEKYADTDLDLCESLFQLKTELQTHREVTP